MSGDNGSLEIKNFFEDLELTVEKLHEVDAGKSGENAGQIDGSTQATENTSLTKEEQKKERKLPIRLWEE